MLENKTENLRKYKDKKKNSKTKKGKDGAKHAERYRLILN